MVEFEFAASSATALAYLRFVGGIDPLRLKGWDKNLIDPRIRIGGEQLVSDKLALTVTSSDTQIALCSKIPLAGHAVRTDDEALVSHVQCVAELAWTIVLDDRRQNPGEEAI